jgi:hypothetical protein
MPSDDQMCHSCRQWRQHERVALCVDEGLQRPPQDRAVYRHVKSSLLRADAVNVKRKNISTTILLPEDQ